MHQRSKDRQLYEDPEYKLKLQLIVHYADQELRHNLKPLTGEDYIIDYSSLFYFSNIFLTFIKFLGSFIIL